ncbi:acyltransferase family protein [Kocuria sp. SM24M-10]|uniref:acyltransferase family protein n=1 Tax=Kocuria sp. SM24M-10 TaxID=1660349 RepID=UPI00064A7023|nr:acyltransferase family protein [Kocuria sp. SM24M-10]KLU11276.1 hypothetical protein ABL57_02180 [Kocuria sp. SM24M-10]
MTSLREHEATPGAGASTVGRVARYSGFRPEVQGLRFVAVLLVVLYHVFLGRVSGGVDVFLLISAFFLTLSFVRKLEAGRPLAIGRYWLHVFKRLLPLAVLTILGTLVLVAAVYPDADVARWRAEGLASVFYVENWALALNAVDYYAADHSTASPFQHFWSLSVQGQVFLLWPLVFGAAWLLIRWRGWRPVPVLAGMFGLIFAASLAWSVHSTATQQAFAYFDTRTRLWEFALGSLLALALPYLRPSRGVRVVLGWAGLVSMVSVGVLVDVQGAFPGWIALWPLASAAAIIVAGRSGSPFGLDRVLASKPLVRLGDASYALYLIHWPLLITYLVLRDRPMAGPRSGAVIILVSLVLAVLATKLVERPFQRWAWPERSKRRLAVSVAVSLALVAVPVLAWHQADARRAAVLAEEAARNNPGAAVLQPGFEFRGDPEAPTLPLAEEMAERPQDVGERCPEEWTRHYPVPSGCHVVRNSDAAGAVVYAVGNSHVEQWIPALEILAAERDWTLITFPRPGCFFTEEHPNPQAECAEWYESTRTFVEDNPPDILLTQATYDWIGEGDEELMTGYRAETEYWTGRGITVLGIRDNPRWPTDQTQCALQAGADDLSCGRPLDRALGPAESPAVQLERDIPRFGSLDMTDVICPEGYCPPAVGNVWVYRDSNHVTDVYARTAIAPFREEWDDAVSRAGFVP